MACNQISHTGLDGVDGIPVHAHLDPEEAAELHDPNPFPVDISNDYSLEKLFCNRCTALSQLPESLPGWRALHTLELRDCTALTRLPDAMSALASLRRLLSPQSRGASIARIVLGVAIWSSRLMHIASTCFTKITALASCCSVHGLPTHLMMLSA